nr:ribonuclease H-like domain-containing protein [Tanacetum cinerariifolium]
MCDKDSCRYQVVDLNGEVGYVCTVTMEFFLLNHKKEWVPHFRIKEEIIPNGLFIDVIGCWNKDGDILIRRMCGNPLYVFYVYNLKSGVLHKTNLAGSVGYPGYATHVGFYHNRCDSSLFTLRQGSHVAYLIIYVDYIILTASSTYLLQAISVSKADSILYRSLASGLQYLTFTRPDISYAVLQICLYMNDPREPHMAALKRILCYIQGTLDFGFHLYSSTTISLVRYTDADWAGCLSTRWSTLAKTAWLHNLLYELHYPLSAATLVYCDNVSATYLYANPVQHQRTKHIEIDIHFVCDLVTAAQVRVLHVPSRYQYADIFTKGLPSALFEDFRSSLSIRLLPAQTAGAAIKEDQRLARVINGLCDGLTTTIEEKEKYILPPLQHRCLLHLAGSQPMLKSSYKAKDGVIISIPPLVEGVADVVVEIKGTDYFDQVFSVGCQKPGRLADKAETFREKRLTFKLPAHKTSIEGSKMFVGNKMHKAFPLPGESSHWQYKFPLPVEGVPTARRMEISLPGVCTAMMKKLQVKEKWQLH